MLFKHYFIKLSIFIFYFSAPALTQTSWFVLFLCHFLNACRSHLHNADLVRDHKFSALKFADCDTSCCSFWNQKFLNPVSEWSFSGAALCGGVENPAGAKSHMRAWRQSSSPWAAGWITLGYIVTLFLGVHESVNGLCVVLNLKPVQVVQLSLTQIPL